MNKEHDCPKCGSDEFVTEPNQYDVLSFTDRGWQIEAMYEVDGFKTFCKKCLAEIDMEKSIDVIVLKK